jgi:GNAT superfamily N-acetyltransferase
VSPTLRPATREDAAALATLMTELGYPTTATEMARRLDVLLPLADHAAWVAVAEGEVVGFAGGRVEASYEKEGLWGRVMALIVAPSRRSQAIGGRLFARLEDELAAKGGLGPPAGERYAARRGAPFL